MLENTRREIRFLPAYDKRKSEDGNNYGIHGCDVSFAIIGEDTAIRLMVFSQWHLLHVRRELESKLINEFRFYHPDSAGISWHMKLNSSEAKDYDGYIVDSCDLLGESCKSDCWYNGLGNDEWYKILTEKGSDGLFEELEKMYIEWFTRYR